MKAEMPRFKTLMELGNKAPALCLWCFDLLHLNGVRITPLTLVERKALLANLVLTVGHKRLQFSGDFHDPLALLRTCQRMGLEGIVSKRRVSAHRPGQSEIAFHRRVTAFFDSSGSGRF